MHYRRFLFWLFFFFGGVLSGCREQPITPQIQNFETHPIYRHYRFSNDENVIEIGAPTPWSTVSQIIEVIKRDEILKKELARMGAVLKFYPFLKGEEIIYFMKKGSLEGAVMGDVPTLKMAAENQIRIISLFNKGSVSLVSRSIYRVRDLKNKRVAYPYGSIAHFYLLRLLQEKGMSESDIQQVPMDTNDMLEAIRQGRIEAFTTFEPTASIFTKEDPTLHTLNRSFSSYGFFSVRKGCASKKIRALQAIVAAQFRAIYWMQKSERNLNQASRWVAEEAQATLSLPLSRYIHNLDTLCAEELLGMVDYKDVLNRALANDGDLRKEYDFLKQKGLIAPGSAWNDVQSNINTDMAQAVSKQRKY